MNTIQVDKTEEYFAIVTMLLLLVLAGMFLWSRILQRRIELRTAELAREVEERKNAIEELRLHQDKLIQADKMTSLGILVSGVAHEINNPNGLILLNMPILKDVYKDAEEALEERFHGDGDFQVAGIPYSRMRNEIPRMLDEMHDGARRIKNIVEDLKDFARRDDDLAKEKFDLNAVLKVAIRLVDSSLRKATHHFSVSYGGALPLMYGTPRRIEQVLVNLLLNACQSLPDPTGGIAVITRLDRHEGVVILTVRDEGVGIAPEHLAHLTDPFFTTRRESGGTGLGLSVSAGIVKEHGGVMSFESTPGRGTTVTLTFPEIQEGE
jgi:polar amino acid transport system substrate-binding protein